MPIILKKNISPKGVLGVWEIEEDEAFFLDALDLDKEESSYISNFKGKRKIEWLASRYLLHLMSERKNRAVLKKDEFGKPILPDSEYHISLSHSHDMVAVIASPSPVGIDIQVHVEKITRLAPKFVNENENKFLDLEDNYLEKLHVIWGAKECLFKAYGRKEVDFKKHIDISKFDFSRLNPSEFFGSLKKPDWSGNFNLHFEFIKNHYLVYAVQT